MNTVQAAPSSTSLGDRVLGDARHTNRGTDRHSFNQALHDLRAAGGIEAVHIDHYA
jgi:hypothetical protein